MAFIPIGIMLKRVFGIKISESFYHYLSYYGKYNNYYAPFGFLKCLKNANMINSTIFFYASVWLDENK